MELTQNHFHTKHDGAHWTPTSIELSYFTSSVICKSAKEQLIRIFLP
jgi:hypothetical protein